MKRSTSKQKIVCEYCQPRRYARLQQQLGLAGSGGSPAARANAHHGRSKTELTGQQYIRSSSTLGGGANTSGSSLIRQDGRDRDRFGSTQDHYPTKGSVPIVVGAGRGAYDSDGAYPQLAPARHPSNNKTSSRKKLHQSLAAASRGGGGAAAPLQIPKLMQIQTLYTRRKPRRKIVDQAPGVQSSQQWEHLKAGKKYVFYSSKESSDVFPQQTSSYRVSPQLPREKIGHAGLDGSIEQRGQTITYHENHLDDVQVFTPEASPYTQQYPGNNGHYSYPKQSGHYHKREPDVAIVPGDIHEPSGIKRKEPRPQPNPNNQVLVTAVGAQAGNHQNKKSRRARKADHERESLMQSERKQQRLEFGGQNDGATAGRPHRGSEEQAAQEQEMATFRELRTLPEQQRTDVGPQVAPYDRGYANMTLDALPNQQIRKVSNDRGMPSLVGRRREPSDPAEQSKGRFGNVLNAQNSFKHGNQQVRPEATEAAYALPQIREARQARRSQRRKDTVDRDFEPAQPTIPKSSPRTGTRDEQDGGGQRDGGVRGAGNRMQNIGAAPNDYHFNSQVYGNNDRRDIGYQDAKMPTASATRGGRLPTSEVDDQRPMVQNRDQDENLKRGIRRHEAQPGFGGYEVPPHQEGSAVREQPSASRLARDRSRSRSKAEESGRRGPSQDAELDAPYTGQQADRALVQDREARMQQIYRANRLNRESRLGKKMSMQDFERQKEGKDPPDREVDGLADSSYRQSIGQQSNTQRLMTQAKQKPLNATSHASLESPKGRKQTITGQNSHTALPMNSGGYPSLRSGSLGKPIQASGMSHDIRGVQHPQNDYFGVNDEYTNDGHGASNLSVENKMAQIEIRSKTVNTSQKNKHSARVSSDKNSQEMPTQVLTKITAKTPEEPPGQTPSSGLRASGNVDKSGADAGALQQLGSQPYQDATQGEQGPSTKPQSKGMRSNRTKQTEQSAVNQAYDSVRKTQEKASSSNKSIQNDSRQIDIKGQPKAQQQADHPVEQSSEVYAASLASLGRKAPEQKLSEVKKKESSEHVDALDDALGEMAQFSSDHMPADGSATGKVEQSHQTQGNRTPEVYEKSILQRSKATDQEPLTKHRESSMKDQRDQGISKSSQTAIKEKAGMHEPKTTGKTSELVKIVRSQASQKESGTRNEPVLRTQSDQQEVEPATKTPEKAQSIVNKQETSKRSWQTLPQIQSGQTSQVQTKGWQRSKQPSKADTESHLKEERKAATQPASRADGLPGAHTGEIEMSGDRAAPENQDAVQKPNISTKAPLTRDSLAHTPGLKNEKPHSNGEQEHKRSRKEKEEPKARPEKSKKASQNPSEEVRRVESQQIKVPKTSEPTQSYGGRPQVEQPLSDEKSSLQHSDKLARSRKSEHQEVMIVKAEQQMQHENHETAIPRKQEVDSGNEKSINKAKDKVKTVSESQGTGQKAVARLAEQPNAFSDQKASLIKDKVNDSQAIKGNQAAQQSSQSAYQQVGLKKKKAQRSQRSENADADSNTAAPVPSEDTNLNGSQTDHRSGGPKTKSEHKDGQQNRRRHKEQKINGRQEDNKREQQQMKSVEKNIARKGEDAVTNTRVQDNQDQEMPSMSSQNNDEKKESKLPEAALIQQKDDHIDQNQQNYTKSHINKNHLKLRSPDLKEKLGRQQAADLYAQGIKLSGRSIESQKYSGGSSQLDSWRKLADRCDLIKESQDFIINIVKQGYQYKEFKWSQEFKHEDIELTNGDAVACNPDGQWRSVQGDLPMGNERGKRGRKGGREVAKPTRYYIRFQIGFKPGMGKCKYFGLSERFSKSDAGKGNWMNKKGIYFGGGNADDADGLYCCVNGRASKISGSVRLQPGDIIGMRFNAGTGEVFFDLNNKDYGLIYRGEELKHGQYFPTADLGIGNDRVKIIQPPKNLMNEIAWKEAGEDLISRETLVNLKKLEQLTKTVDQQQSDTTQKHLFHLVTHHLFNTSSSLEELLKGLIPPDAPDGPLDHGNASAKVIDELFQAYGHAEILEPSAFRNNPKTLPIQSEATLMKKQLLEQIVAVQREINRCQSTDAENSGQYPDSHENQDLEHDTLCNLLLEKLLQYPLSQDLADEFKDQLDGYREGRSFYEVQEFLAQAKLYEVQNYLKSMDYIEFRGLLDMIGASDAEDVGDKGSQTHDTTPQRINGRQNNHKMVQMIHAIHPGSSKASNDENEHSNQYSHEYSNQMAAGRNNFTHSDEETTHGRSNGQMQPRNKLANRDRAGLRNMLKRQSDEDCLEITSCMMRSIQRAIRLTRQKYEEVEGPGQQRVVDFSEFLRFLSRPHGQLE